MNGRPVFATETVPRAPDCSFPLKRTQLDELATYFPEMGGRDCAGVTTRRALGRCVKQFPDLVDGKAEIPASPDQDQVLLQPGEFDVLATLRRSGEPFALSPTALYESAMISSGGMTNRIDRLEKAGLVQRQPDPVDRRAKLILLTPVGKALIDDTLSKHVDNERRVLSALTPEEQHLLDDLLKKLIQSI